MVMSIHERRVTYNQVPKSIPLPRCPRGEQKNVVVTVRHMCRSAVPTLHSSLSLSRALSTRALLAPVIRMCR